MKLIILITSNVENGLDVAVRWQEAGAPGVTVLKSFGLYSLQRKMTGDGLEVPLHMASSMSSMMAYVLREMELNNHVLLSVVPEELAPTLLDEARAVMGDSIGFSAGALTTAASRADSARERRAAGLPK